ncbi:MAG: hypothetical protein F6K19_09925 [Cyanothece sp. SIO1E1]|nr:hypothetical protein [Cyanothece sp. SIO1E1]
MRRRLIILLLIMGIGCRFANLDFKVYWFDQVLAGRNAGGRTALAS